MKNLKIYKYRIVVLKSFYNSEKNKNAALYIKLFSRNEKSYYLNENFYYGKKKHFTNVHL